MRQSRASRIRLHRLRFQRPAQFAGFFFAPAGIVMTATYVHRW
ncbi:hypothetical protein RR42_m1805 [Cupriavidus basilensis]|uniref:Uncharacterized protein n=1 Tax=Cupriavidus basilensis TaxID=68895 RepID=A0A0C4Y276_9BURK|nr:hypothetical protein RR42_m1805 [Cupriavidus basilensis]